MSGLFFKFNEKLVDACKQRAPESYIHLKRSL